MQRRRHHLTILLVAAILAVTGCALQKKAAALPGEKVEINLPELSDFLPDNVSGAQFAHSDTLVVKGEDGQDVLLMKAIKDDETGEMVATDVIDAAVVTARFRNKAERNGKVDLEFEIRVPAPMLDGQWEMTLWPDLFIMGDSLRLEPVILTGEAFRRKQEKGYERYQRYEDHIVTDSAAFVRHFLLDRFTERNYPEGDSLSWSGVERQEAVRHYTQDARKRRHQRMWDNRPRRFARLVKVPIPTEGVRMDSVVRAPFQDFVYTYVQTIRTRPNLRKVNLVLSGEIRRQEKHVYTIPTTDSLTFYISTLSNFVRDIVRFKTQIVYRRAEANASCLIVFPVGKDDIRPEMGRNAAEIDRIKQHLKDLISNEVYDLDSILVTASCSPDGVWEKNAQLSLRRSASVTRYFGAFIDHLRDSVDLARGFEVDADGVIHKEEVATIPLVARANAENWDDLDRMIAADTVLTAEQRERYFKIRENRQADSREYLLRREKFFPHLRDSLYPLLRTVTFDFHLHRKGMVKDTVQTTVPDDVYAAGVQALRDRDFERAIELLAPYGDYNTAVAYLSMDRNYSALQILEKEEKTAEVNYMMAILRSRINDIQGAVEAYMEACRQNPVYISRGNLDPEISVLIKTYGLNKQDEEEFW